MKVKENYSKHFIALSLLFILGNACITAPEKTADEFNFLAYLITCAIAVAVYFAFGFVPINKITIIPIWLLGFYCISDAFITFVKFISDNLLYDTHRILIILPFLAIIGYMSFKKTEVLYKFSLLFGVFALAVILLFFLSTAKDFNARNIFIYNLPTVNTLYKQLLPYFKNIVLPTGLLAVFKNFVNIKKSTALAGLTVGFVLFGICLLNSVLLFGIEFSGVLDYPYSSAGSTVTFGYLFTRLDGFLYFVYLSSCAVKCVVGIFVIKKSREKLSLDFLL